MAIKRPGRSRLAQSREQSDLVAKKVAEGRRLLDEALGSYGEPSMSLAELRDALAKQLPGLSLSEFIIQEREAGA